MLDEDREVGVAARTPRRLKVQVGGAGAQLGAVLLWRQGDEAVEVQERQHGRRQQIPQHRRELGGLAERQLKQGVMRLGHARSVSPRMGLKLTDDHLRR